MRVDLLIATIKRIDWTPNSIGFKFTTRVPLEHRIRVEMTLPPGRRGAGRCGTGFLLLIYASKPLGFADRGA